MPWDCSVNCEMVEERILNTNRSDSLMVRPDWHIVQDTLDMINACLAGPAGLWKQQECKIILV